jgi:hypothetical protein
MLPCIPMRIQNEKMQIKFLETVCRLHLPIIKIFTILFFPEYYTRNEVKKNEIGQKVALLEETGNSHKIYNLKHELNKSYLRSMYNVKVR